MKFLLITVFSVGSAVAGIVFQDKIPEGVRDKLKELTTPLPNPNSELVDLVNKLNKQIGDRDQQILELISNQTNWLSDIFQSMTGNIFGYIAIWYIASIFCWAIIVKLFEFNGIWLKPIINSTGSLIKVFGGKALTYGQMLGGMKGILSFMTLGIYSSKAWYEDEGFKSLLEKTSKEIVDTVSSALLEMQGQTNTIMGQLSLNDIGRAVDQLSSLHKNFLSIHDHLILILEKVGATGIDLNSISMTLAQYGTDMGKILSVLVIISKVIQRVNVSEEVHVGRSSRVESIATTNTGSPHSSIGSPGPNPSPNLDERYRASEIRGGDNVTAEIDAVVETRQNEYNALMEKTNSYREKATADLESQLNNVKASIGQLDNENLEDRVSIGTKGIQSVLNIISDEGATDIIVKTSEELFSRVPPSNYDLLPTVAKNALRSIKRTSRVLEEDKISHRSFLIDPEDASPSSSTVTSEIRRMTSVASLPFEE